MVMTKITRAVAATLAIVVMSMTQSIEGFVPPTGMTRIMEMESIKTLDNCMLSKQFMSSADDVSNTIFVQ
jgi:hypothetical protein